ncbi:hypothetical protein CLV78_103381 [Aliiruegeria haliotis]|uniref:CENP-V/GFA domain-containing protein n=1 Tax=Aliiruegeria haliotis TaxID=1280846 RepID=A0A2T0RTK4_9RHOB|nr:GFA family protein [Aliiruegeria haliotis]PRY24514.1 hypothetical protein CLV78_103381 [Aliiruegeria haliotis]
MGAVSTGQCLCGAVKVRAVDLPREMSVCHCDMCRTWTGGMPFAGVSVVRENVTFEGQEAIRIYRSSKWVERGFCGTCGTNLFFRMAGAAATANMSLAPGVLDSMNEFALVEEEYVDVKPAGYAFAGNLKQVTRAQMHDALSAHLQGLGLAV